MVYACSALQRLSIPDSPPPHLHHDRLSFAVTTLIPCRPCCGRFSLLCVVPTRMFYSRKGATNGCFHGWLNRQNFTALRSKSVARLRLSHGQPTIAQSVLTVKQGIAMELFSWRDVCIWTFETASLSRKAALQGCLNWPSSRVSPHRSFLDFHLVQSSVPFKCVAMDDGVLVPWKKNRPEDTKSALELLHADRGGLYLDSRPGVYASVIELDFASLFPSIIATRNISPETLNCSCCQPQESPSTGGFVPLPPDDAVREFRERGLRSRFGHGLFPLAHEKALRAARPQQLHLWPDTRLSGTCRCSADPPTSKS